MALLMLRTLAMPVHRFTDLRAWQTCWTYKNAVYKLCRESPIAGDAELARQLSSAVASAPANIAEGFARFNPPDNARFVVIARASLVESQNHLRDAVDRGHITEEERVAHDQIAELALREVNGWLSYLRSSEAFTKARKVRERQAAREHRERGT